MDELLNLLGVANEKDAIIKVKALQSNTLSLQEKLNAQTIETAVQNKQILPSQKGFALNLLNQSKDMYNQFIEGNKIPDLTAKVDLEEPEIEVPVTASNVKNFEQLLNDEKLHDEFKKTNPKAYAQLYKNYHEGE